MCPHCDEPLVVFELEGIEIDHCMECGGTWLDAGELEMLAELEGVEPGGLSKALQITKADHRSELRCPRCNKKMDTIHIGTDDPIELERCHRGHGLWMDKGEMLDIIRSYNEGEEGTVAGFFSNLYQDELKTEST